MPTEFETGLPCIFIAKCEVSHRLPALISFLRIQQNTKTNTFPLRFAIVFRTDASVQFFAELFQFGASKLGLQHQPTILEINRAMQDAQRVKSCLLFKQEAKKESEEIRLLFFSEEYFNFVIQNLGNDGRGDDKLSKSDNGCIDQFIFFDSPSQPEIINDYINCMNPLAKSHPLKLLIFLTDFEEEFTTKTAISDIPRVALSKKVVFDLTDKIQITI
ncbi:MAG: hypothetical protein EZS28_001327 [Streblomastix strix]|uniref:Uncharacterized protein n=1 Tax=Streblomastix strix TaxID=222440 RepID=A0A5J4X9E6_9EUKA|nr:MAG: hypothetical protein EZS28_001327 [Streblomastix strix]